MAEFDVDAARKSGATDDEILDYLSKRAPKFDTQGALQHASKDEVIRYLAVNSEPPTPTKTTTSFKAAPQPWSIPWVKEKLYNVADSLTEALPAAGATAGAVIGGGSGMATGGTTSIPGAIGGAGMGGMAGEALKQHVRRALGFEDVPQTGADAAREITKQGVLQGGTQAVAEALPMAAQPVRNFAVKQYEKALAPTTKAMKATVQKIQPEMMQRGIRGSLESIEGQAADKATELRPQIDAAIEAIPEQELNAFLERYNVPAVTGGTTDEIKAALAAKRAEGQIGTMASTVPSRVLAPKNQIVEQVGSQAATVPESVFGPRQGTKMVVERTAGPTQGAGKKVFDALEDLKNSYKVEGKVADSQAVNAIQGVQDVVSQFGDDISAKSLRRLRQIFDNPVAKKGGYAGADLSTSYALQAKEQAANTIREILAEASPDVARLNKEMSFWLNVQKVAQESGLRRVGQEGGLLRTLGPLAAAGAAGAGLSMAHQGPENSVGGAGMTAVLTALAVASRTPRWRTTSGLLKDSLADALASGNVSRASSLLFRLGIAVPGATKANRTADQTQEQSQPAQ